MLVIRNAQMNALRKAILSNVEAQAWAEWPEPHRPALEQIRSAMSRAGSYGLSSKDHLMRFLAVCRTLGIEFDRDSNRAWASEILNDPELTPPLKLALIEDRARQE
jgi:hypothetical protein